MWPNFKASVVLPWLFLAQRPRAQESLHSKAYGRDVINVSKTRVIPNPGLPPEDRQIVKGNFQGYSVEFNWMLDFAGNNSHPNEFSYRMLQNLQNISGAYPTIRAGGTTQNRAVFVENQTEALIQTFGSNPDQPSSLTIGPAWSESFQQMPKGTKYIYGLNFYDGEDGLNQTVLEATYAFRGIGDGLYAFEIGNEVDGWPCSSRRPCNWTIDKYVAQWQEYAAAVGDVAIGHELDDSLEPLFQGCAFQAPRHLGYNETPFWNVENAIKFGMASTGRVKQVADHDYMGSACKRASVPTIANNLLNHHHITSTLYKHEALGNYTHSQNITYVLGETNSISCQGLRGVSDVYAAALWSIDYVLYVATLHVAELYFHMGTPYRYSPWQPANYNGTVPYVKPLYYGNLFTATALAGGNKQVVSLVNETRFTAYGIYEAAVDGNTDSKLTGLALLNLEMWNSTQPTNERPYTAVKLLEGFEQAKVSRLTSPGVEIAGNITFAGQSMDDYGYFVGSQVIESVDNGTVLVGASEAVLIQL